jgi:membrane-associated protease RseP (regulator of RpoE activity)
MEERVPVVNRYPSLIPLLARMAVVLLLVAGLALYQCSVHDHRRREEAAALQLDRELGVTAEALVEDLAADFGLPPHSRGLVITSLAEGRAAERAGLQPGDVIEQIDSYAIVDAESAAEALDDGDGRLLRLVVNRHGRAMTVELGRDSASAPRLPSGIE